MANDYIIIHCNTNQVIQYYYPSPFGLGPGRGVGVGWGGGVGVRFLLFLQAIFMTKIFSVFCYLFTSCTQDSFL